VRLIAELERRVAQEQSLFRAQLLREDIGRLRRLEELAHAAPDLAAFKQTASRIGWTQGDARTHELGSALDRFLEAVHAGHTGIPDDAQELRIRETWLELHRTRMERLVGCLSTPVPKPVE